MAQGNTRLKKAIRHRMSQTGETYSTAMAQVLKQLEQGSKGCAPNPDEAQSKG